MRSFSMNIHFQIDSVQTENGKHFIFGAIHVYK